jgi:hypothetical protein
MLRKAAILPLFAWCVACSPSPQETPTETEEKEEEIQAFATEASRVSTRILFYKDTEPPSSPGELAINYGQPRWKPEYEEMFDELTKGKRWRFGNNYWTGLDTNVEISISGTDVSPGQYYLAIERTSEDQWYLLLLNPEIIRAEKLDAFYVDEAPPGVRVALQWSRTSEDVEKLTVRLVPDEDEMSQASLDIQWGGHRLQAPVRVRF